MMAGLRLLWVVWIKELRDAVRDRRSVLSALVFPLFAPAMTYFMLSTTADIAKDVHEIDLPVEGAALAPELIDFLEQYHVTVEPAPSDPVAAVERGEHELVLRIDKAYPERIAAGLPADIDLIVDGSQQRTSAKSRRVTQLLSAYSGELAQRRLLARGLNPLLVRPLTVQEIETASGQQLAGRILASIPMFVLMAAFFCGMQVAVDTTAGERERGSLEPLLLTAAPRHILAGGKWLAACVFASVGVVLTLLLSNAALSRIPLHELGMQARIGPTELWAIGLLTVPLAFFATGLQLLVGTFARSFKEAQVYVTLIAFLPVLPGIFTMVNPITDPTWHLAVPALGQQILVSEALAGDTISLPMVFGMGLVTIAFGATAAWLTAHLFGHERIIYGR